MGIIIALSILCCWILNLFFCLNYIEINISNTVLYTSIIIQAFLHTGLFITAHDAMHNTVSSNKTINLIIGWATSILYSGFLFNKLKHNHFQHHRFPSTQDDPDYFKNNNGVQWFFHFMWKYTTIWQLIIVASLFNIMLIWYSEVQLILFYVVPAFISSIQLFIFGIYFPHKRPHTPEMEPYKARSQRKNDLIAFLSCYFFGYHYEHHKYPFIPWWKLALKKN